MKKNLRIYLFVAATIAVLFSCSDEKKTEEGKDAAIHYSVHGTITNAGAGKAYLESIKGKQWVVIDSSELKNGEVDFSGTIDTVDIYRLRLTNNSYLPLILNADTIAFKADASNFFETVTYTGSKDNETYANFNKKILAFNKTHTGLSKMLDSLKHVVAPSIIATNCMNEIKSVEADMKAFVQQSIKANTASPVVFSMLSYADWENDFPFIESVTTTIKQQQPNYKYTKSLVTNVSQYKTYLDQKLAKEKGNPAAIGKEAPEFVLPDVNGKMIRLSSFRGKYILLDFWASWCGPCRQESPNVVKAYNKYKGKNFDIFSVSLDDNKDKWLNAIQKDGLTWTHVSDLHAWESSVVRLYQVEGIPATFLLDPKGVVIARDLRGNELEEKLEELLK